jgi:allantoin racemase
MRKILVIDPITTDFFNDMTKNYLEEIKSPDIEIEVVNIKAGSSSIETFYDEAFALPGI